MEVTITKDQLKRREYPVTEVLPLSNKQARAVAQILFNILDTSNTTFGKDVA